MLSVVMLGVIMLSIVMLSIVMPNVPTLSVISPNIDRPYNYFSNGGDVLDGVQNFLDFRQRRRPDGRARRQRLVAAFDDATTLQERPQGGKDARGCDLVSVILKVYDMSPTTRKIS
jgi:hypothetical protein